MRLFNSLGLAYMFVSVFVLCMFMLIVVTDKIEKYVERKIKERRDKNE